MNKLAAVLFGLLATQVAADERDRVVPSHETGGPIPGGWAIAISPYLWATGLAGDAGGGGTIVHIDESFGDILDDLDFGFLGTAEVRYGRIGVFSDFIYGKLSSIEDSPIPAYVREVGTTSATAIWTAAAEYRIVDHPRGHLDALAGIRLFSLANEIRYRGGSLDGLGGKQSVTWADPVIGLKGNVDITARVYLTGWAMIGGFGVSSGSLWDVMGGAGYRFNDRVSSTLGYRAAGVDHRGDDFIYDTVLEGLFAGVVLQY